VFIYTKKGWILSLLGGPCQWDKGNDCVNLQGLKDLSMLAKQERFHKLRNLGVSHNLVLHFESLLLTFVICVCVSLSGCTYIRLTHYYWHLHVLMVRERTTTIFSIISSNNCHMPHSSKVVEI
jgi:hypothetical protein